MVVKIPLMTLFHVLHLLITGKPWIDSADDALATLQRSEIIFFIPLYLIYLPLFIYNVKTHRVEPRFMYWDMSMICMVVCPLAFVISFQYGLWFAFSTAFFVATYLMLTAAVHLRLCWPYIFVDGDVLPYSMDKTLPEYAQWQTQVENSKKERQEKFETKHAAKLQETAEKKIRKKTHNKIEYIFFYTGLFATTLSAIAVISLCYLIMSAHTCYVFSSISTECFQTWAWKILKPSLGDIFIYIAVIFFVPMGLYVAIIFALYGPVIKCLWYGNMRTYAHFGLAANIPILAYLLAIQGTTNEAFPHDLRVISFYLFSYTTLLTSVLHLNFLKRYDKAFGIPEEPPRPQRWYDRFFGRKTADA